MVESRKHIEHTVSETSIIFLENMQNLSSLNLFDTQTYLFITYQSKTYQILNFVLKVVHIRFNITTYEF